jgi:hypothetical protein
VENINIAANTSRTTKCREPQHKNNTFIDEINVHLPLQGENLQQSISLLQ